MIVLIIFGADLSPWVDIMLVELDVFDGRVLSKKAIGHLTACSPSTTSSTAKRFSDEAKDKDPAPGSSRGGFDDNGRGSGLTSPGSKMKDRPKSSLVIQD